MISDTAYESMVKKWRYARLTADTESMGYPKINILILALMGRGGRNIGLSDQEVSDADIVQTIVNKMPQEMKVVYEANLICLINGNRYAGVPHHMRAKALGVPKSTYWHRFNSGVNFVKKWLDDVFDRLD